MITTTATTALITTATTTTTATTHTKRLNARTTLRLDKVKKKEKANAKAVTFRLLLRALSNLC